METKRIGLIGCGARLSGLVKLMKDKCDQVEFSSIYDPSDATVENVQEEINPEIRRCDSYLEITADPSIDWVMIGSWNAQHCEHAVAAFEDGKHVFCEKPLATNLSDCLTMREAWRKSGKHLSIGFTLRYSPFYRKIKELLESGIIGDVISMESNETLDFNHGGFIHGDWRRLRENAGTHLLEKCCHDLDLVNWLIGSRGHRVASFGGCDFFIPENENRIDELGKNEGGRDAYQTWRSDDPNPFTADKNIFDNQVALIEFKNHVRATFHTNCNAGIPERRMYILGTHGAIRGDVLDGKIEVRKIGFNENTEIVDSGIAGGHGGGDSILTDELLESILQNREPNPSLHDGLNSAVLAFALDDAADSGQVVSMETYWQQVDA